MLTRFTRNNRKFFSSLNVPEHKMLIDGKSYRLAHPIWSIKDAEKVTITHHKPQGFKDWFAYGIMKTLRTTFDWLSGYKPGKMTENLYLRRFIFLETVAGVPGMIGGMVRHLKSLGSLREDGGWIHHLLEEAENERMHLFTFLGLRSPGILFRIAVLGTQGIFLTGFTSMYVLSPKTAHRFVGYLEEEAVKTYSNCIQELDEGKLSHWARMPATADAIQYWGLSANATLRDVLIAVRADEVMHREVNHHLANIPNDAKVAGHKYFFTSNPVGEAHKFPKAEAQKE